MSDERFRRLAELGVPTVYEASGRAGLIDLPLVQLILHTKIAGPARTALCGPGDNLMVHAVMEHILPGEVLVLAMTEPAPVALIGEILAVQAKIRGAAGILVDGAVRDVEELAELGLPVWARHIRATGATKTKVGALNIPVEVGGVRIAPGDAVVLDSNGGVCVAQGQIDAVLVLAEARLEREAQLLARLSEGELTFDIHGLRAAAPKNEEEKE